SGGVTRLTVPLDHIDGATNAFRFELYTDSGGLPGTTLGTIGDTPGSEWPQSPPPPPLVVQGTGSVTVASGTTYWLVARAFGDAQGSIAWNVLNRTGLRAYQLNSAAWAVDPVTMPA